MAWIALEVGQARMTLAHRTLGWLRYAVPGVLLAAIVAGIFLPVYTDEVGWRFQERAALDGVDKLFSDLCGPNTLAAPPFFMMPVRYYSAFFNTMFADPFYVRLSGVLYALVWVAMLLALIGRIARDGEERAALTIIGAGLMCLGTLPLLLVWSRPEQPILLLTTAALLLAWRGSEGNAAEVSRSGAWLRSGLIVAFATFALSYHLKAVFLAPVFLAAVFFASRGRQAIVPRLAATVVIAVVVGWSLQYWGHRMQCPGDPILRAQYAYNSHGMDIIESRNFAELLAGLVKLLGNINITDYFSLVAPRPDPLSNWLAPDQIDRAGALRWHAALVLGWSAITLFAVASLVGRAWESWRARKLETRSVLAAALLAAVLGWSATQGHRNVYEACLVLPLVMLSILLAISGRSRGDRSDAFGHIVTLIVGLCALASPLAIAAIYAPSIVHANRQAGYILEQVGSQPVFGYASLEPDILGAARKCGIGDPATARALMIDDVTYFAFMESRMPQHRLGVLGLWRGTIDDPVAYLRSRGSSGAILGCHLLPPDLRARARSEGRFCCLGPPNW